VLASRGVGSRQSRLRGCNQAQEVLFEAHGRLAVKALRIRMHGEQKDFGIDLDFGGWFPVWRNPEIVLHWNIPSKSIS
jgi:hypothetical protein